MLFEMEEAGSETLVCLLNTVDGYLSRYVPESVHGEPAERNWRYVDDLLFLRRIGLIEIRRSMYIRGGLRTESTLRDGAEFDRALQKMRSLTWDSSVSRWTSGPGTDDLEIVLTDEGELALRT
jgi:hypothetical protein